MNTETFNQELLLFLQQSPTPFHAVASLSALLKQAGFTLLSEADSWQLEQKTGYYVVRNDSSVAAFKTGANEMVESGFRIAGAHTDSPCLKIKPSPELSKHGYSQLGVEVYGGALLHPWFDRDLSIAGRVDFECDDGSLQSVLVNLKEPIAFIPSLAIHLDRTANEGRKIDKQKELPPILVQLSADEKFEFNQFLLTHLQRSLKLESAVKILSHELLLYDVQPPSLVGLQKQFIASARLDNLLSCFLSLQALINSDDEFPSVLICNDHEEVGSVSASGAEGPFLKSVLQRMLASTQSDHTNSDAFDRAMNKSVLLSIDNAHGSHPNFSDKHDESHRPLLNAGPVIKVNANQRYASNSKSIALFKSLCNKLKIKHQSFVMRSDLACGSTIGPITAASLGVNTVDVGVASFAMHSIREFAGVEDAVSLAKVTTAFYNR